jgi:hypothetical protein
MSPKTGCGIRVAHKEPAWDVVGFGFCFLVGSELETGEKKNREAEQALTILGKLLLNLWLDVQKLQAMVLLWSGHCTSVYSVSPR